MEAHQIKTRFSMLKNRSFCSRLSKERCYVDSIDQVCQFVEGDLLLKRKVNLPINSNMCNSLDITGLFRINLTLIINILRVLLWLTIHNTEWFIDLSQLMEHHSSVLLPYLKEI